MARNPLAGAVLRCLNTALEDAGRNPPATFADLLASAVVARACDGKAPDNIAAARLVAEIVAQADPVLDAIHDNDA